MRGDKAGDKYFRQFKVLGTPTILIIGPDGTEIDWLRGYDPPSRDFLERLKRSLQGIDTFKSLRTRYDQGPRTVDVVFKLAQKYSQRLDTSQPEEKQKLVDLYKEILALDPDGKKGTTKYLKKDVTYTEYAELELARQMSWGRERTIGPLQAFIAKYPDGVLTSRAYGYLASYFLYSASKEDAANFFEGYIAKYPNDPTAIEIYLDRIIRDKEPLDRGIELAEKVDELVLFSIPPRWVRKHAELYALKNEIEQAEALYGRTYMEDEQSSFSFSLVDFADFWLRQKKHTDDAVAMCEIALKLNPDSIQYVQNLAGVYNLTGREDRALEVYGPGFTKKSWDNSQDLVWYANFWARQGKNLESALEAAQRAVDLSPDPASPAYYALSLICLKLKKYDEAVQAAEKAASLAPEPDAEFYKKHLEAAKKARDEAK